MAIAATISETLIELKAVRDKLEKQIFELMSERAEEIGLTKMYITHLGNSYLVGDEEVDDGVLDLLDGYYLEHIHSGGFEGLWDNSQGWH